MWWKCSIKGWHNLGIGIIPGTVMSLHVGLLWNGHHPQGPCQWLCWCCTSLEQCLCVCDQSPMVFGLEWEVKLQEKCWLLFCAAAPLADMWHFGQLCCLFWKAGKWAPESCNVIQHARWSRESTAQRKTSLRCGERLDGPSPFRAGKVVSGEGIHENWWLLGLYFDTTGSQSVLGAEQAVVTGCLDLFPLQPFPIRTSCGALQHSQSSGLFVLQEVSELSGWTWVLKGGVVVLEAVSSLFFMITCTSPCCVGGWWDTGKGGCSSHITHLPVWAVVLLASVTIIKWLYTITAWGWTGSKRPKQLKVTARHQPGCWRQRRAWLSIYRQEKLIWWWILVKDKAISQNWGWPFHDLQYILSSSREMYVDSSLKKRRGISMRVLNYYKSNTHLFCVNNV